MRTCYSVLFEEVAPRGEIRDQRKVGVMSHWEAKRLVSQQEPEKTFFTLTKTEYDQLRKKPKSRKH